jgi:hypothetical protein
MFSPEHYPIIFSMPNPFDYSTFLVLCRAKNVIVLTQNDYNSSIDLLFPGRRTTKIPVPSRGTSPRSCCGGGRTR